MLKGFYNYGDYTYALRGYDFGTNIAMYLTAVDMKSKKALDHGIKNFNSVVPPMWDDLYLNIGINAIKIDSYTDTDTIVTEGDTLSKKDYKILNKNPYPYEEGKWYYEALFKNSYNVAILSKLGAILGGMRSNCSLANRENGGDLFNMGFSPSRSITYTFENGKMTLNMKTIISVSYRDEANNIALTLEEDGSYGEKIEELTKTTQKIKINPEDLSEFVTKSDELDNAWDYDDNTIFSLQEIIERNPDKSYVWLYERKYEVVKGIDRVEEICKEIWKHDGLVSFDTETTGLNVNVTSRQGIGDRLVGMVFSIKSGEAYYFPIAHKKVENICTPETEYYVIEKYFKPLLENKKLICFNGSFDWKVMYTYDIFCNIVEDMYILFKVTLWNDHRYMALGLKSLTHEFLGRDSFELKDFTAGKFGENVKFWDLEEESVKYYACPDTDNLIDLYEWTQKERLLEKYGAKRIYEIEVAFSLVIAYQEYYGHCVDVSKIDKLVEDIKETKEREYNAMVAIAKHDFNPASPKDIQKVFFEELNYPVIAYTDTGAPCMDKHVRKELMRRKNADGSDMYPMAKHLQEYKESQTLQSNFTNNISKFATDDGLMFSQVNQFLETGRVSVNDPNYQSYSDVVKKYIIPREGYYALDADYSTVEARIMISMAGCKNMVEKLKNPDTDYHTSKASDMNNVPYELVTHDMRKKSKGVNFGILYGLGDPNLGAELYGAKTPENTLKAKKMKKLYFKGMDELRVFIDVSKRQGIENSYSTTFFGRRRYFDPRKVRKDTIERQSCNARIQGTAADIYKLAMVRLLHSLRKEKLMGKILISAFVHDECFLEVHKSLDPSKVLNLVRTCMMVSINNWCPLFIGCGFGRNWYEAKNTEIPVQVQEKICEMSKEGIDWWDGDSNKLYEWEVNEINDYRVNRVISYLKNEDNWGKVLAPVENSLAHEVLDEIKKGVKVHGVVTTDVETSDDMLENLHNFCIAFGCEDLFEKADVKKPEHTTSTNIDDVSLNEEVEEEEVDDETTIKNVVGSVGVFTFKGVIYFRYEEKNLPLMRAIRDLIEKNPGNTEVYTVKEGKIYSTGLKMSLKAYTELLKLFLMFK